MKKVTTYIRVWDAIADTHQQAANLNTRSEIIRQITAIVKEGGWTQTEAAERCGVTQPRMNDLLRGRLSRFSLDALVNIAAAVNQRVHIVLEPIYAAKSETKKTKKPRVLNSSRRAG